MTAKSWRFGEEELVYVKEVLDSGLGASTYGTMNTRLEKAFAQRFGVRYGITHNSGTSTLHSCLAAAGVGPGDEVISPALTVISDAAVTLHHNAVPVFADIDPDTFNMDPKDVERKITPRTKAIMPVHLYGLPCDMDPIMALAKKHNLVVIEDAAQCFLGQYKGRLAGTIGHMASFSFENTKHMSTGDGGIVITNDERLAEAVRKFACLGYSMVTADSGQVRTKAFAFQDPNYKRHTSLGWQYRLPEVCAALGMAQLARLNDYVAKRQAIWALYADAVEDCSFLKPQFTPPGYVNACWTFAAKYEGEESLGVSWHDFAEKFHEFSGEGIYAAWSVVYLEPVIAERRFYGHGCPTACPHCHSDIAWGKGLCPVAESVQPKLMQFKGNIGDLEEARRQADALRRTIEFFASSNGHGRGVPTPKMISRPERSRTHAP
jgi:perosamine synthetase